MRRGALVALLWASAAHAQALVVPPHLSELAPDGFSVLFETDADVEGAVEVARAGAAFVRAGSSKGRLHRVHVTGLSPLESVRYRVVVGGTVLATSQSRSGPADGASALDFVVYGDTRGGAQVERVIIDEIRTLTPALALHTGDFVPVGGDERWWRQALVNEAPLTSETPVYLAIGNHELLSDPVGLLARRFLPPPADGPSYYTFRVGPARFVVLDSNHLSPPQLAWLDETLAAAATERASSRGTASPSARKEGQAKPHVFVFMHHPPFSDGDHCGASQSQHGLVALLERYKPTAVFAGHDHAYERLELNGLRYFVSGGGGAPLYGKNDYCGGDDKRALKVYRPEYHLLRVRIRGAAVEVEVLRPGQSDIETVRWNDPR